MKKYDVVLIGSGLGALACAYMLAKEGKSVCVLEKNRQIGGNLQIFSRDKAVFDTGIHYIGGLDKGQNLYKFFRYFDIMDDLKLQKLDENGFDVICFGNDKIEYRHANGYERFIETLAGYFPEERENIQKYCDKIREICELFPLYNLEVAGSDYFEKTMPFFTQSVSGYIDSVTTNQKLRNVLGGTNPLYAGELDKTPLYIHALVINSYIESAYKCVDGGGQIATLMVRNIKKLGGEVRNYSECTKFNFNGERIESVELATGEKVEGELFISNIHPSNTMDMIEAGKIRKAYVSRIQSLENVISVFILNLVMEKDSFPYLNYNLYYYKDESQVWNGINETSETWPSLYCLFSPSSSRSNGHSECLTIMAYMNYSEVEKWKDTFHTIPRNRNTRGEGYEEFKKEKAEKLLDLVSEKFPDIRKQVKSYTTSTPLTYRDYIGIKDGSLYGISRDYKDPLKTFIHTKTKVPNLYMTGQSVHVHGVLGVSIGAILTVAEIIGLDNIVDRIREANKED